MNCNFELFILNSDLLCHPSFYSLQSREGSSTHPTCIRANLRFDFAHRPEEFEGKIRPYTLPFRLADGSKNS